jgi:hypothetical protein
MPEGKEKGSWLNPSDVAILAEKYGLRKTS